MNTDCKTTETDVQNVPLNTIDCFHTQTQLRVAVDGDQLDNLKAAFEAGADIPPVDLFRVACVEGKPRYVIADGWHRFHAAAELGRDTIAARIHEGGRQDALKFALSANASHGLRRSNKDKRHCAEVAIAEFPKLSNRALADLCKVHHSLVDGLRPSAQLADSASSRVGKDGKTRRQPQRDPRQTDWYDDFLRTSYQPFETQFKNVVNAPYWMAPEVKPEAKLDTCKQLKDALRAQIHEIEKREAQLKQELIAQKQAPAALAATEASQEQA
jgi:uncharacterized ParB-like nuclease family protein